MDVALLLSPLSPEAPCGEDLSFSLEFDAILALRRSDDPTLDQGAWVRPLKVADWPGVIAACQDLLRHRTKDLRVAGWLTDAAARVEGLAGLADGLELCAGLCAAHWNTLHPRPEEGDMAQRSGSLAWLLGQVGELASLSTEAAPGRADALARALGAVDRLQALFDAHAGDDGPSFVGARQVLEAGLARARRGEGGEGGVPPSRAEPEPMALDHDVAGGGPPKVESWSVGPPASRVDALRQLRAVADFFRRTEPHSPVAYLAEKAAAWGDMPLHTWLRTVLKDPGALAQVEELLGVTTPDIAL